MPFRLLTRPAASQPTAPADSLTVEPRSVWRTSLLVASSAVFGGIAVAIWNRRTLALMRQNDDMAEPPAEE